MLNLDTAEKIEYFSFVWKAKTYNYDPLVLADKLNPLREMKDNSSLPIEMTKILGLDQPLESVFEAMLVLNGFSEFMKEQESLLKKTFPHLQSSTISTESVQESTKN